MKTIIELLGFAILLTFMGCHMHKSSSAHGHVHDHDEYHTHDGNSHSHKHKGIEVSKETNDYFGAYTLEDKGFGTRTIVKITGNVRTMVTNALPNHETGEFPGPGNPNTISAQNKTYSFPLNPKYIGVPNWVREPGVALNGVKFEPGTAEVVECDTGENYRVEAFQNMINLGLDFNNAHVQPSGAYHYHGTPTSVVESFDTGEDLVHVGFALDGFPIYYSKSGMYKPSYKLLGGNREGEDCTYETRRSSRDISIGGHHDGTYTSDFEFVEGSGDLDECNGINLDGNYIYLVTDEFPYVSRCLMGEVSTNERRGRPTLTQLMENMDNNNDGKISKSEARGPLASRFGDVDKNNDGFIIELELQQMQPPNLGQRRRE
ncbi:MAG: YHYH protein [Jejuia sp.]